MHYMYIRSWTSSAYAANDSCVACSDVAAKRQDHPRRATCDPCLDSQRGSECIGAATCECSGGERGRALMCPAEGYFLVVDQAKEALIDPEGKAVVDVARADNGRLAEPDPRLRSDWGLWVAAVAQWLAAGMSLWL